MQDNKLRYNRPVKGSDKEKNFLSKRAGSYREEAESDVEPRAQQ